MGIVSAGSPKGMRTASNAASDYGQRGISMESAGQLRIMGIEEAEEAHYGPLMSDGAAARGAQADGAPITPNGSLGAVREAIDIASLDELQVPEVLNFNASIYDLTIQYSCNVAHRHGDFAGITNLVMVLVLQMLNVYLQMNILVEVDELIAKPAMAHAQRLYQLFTAECYSSDSFTFSEDVERNFQLWQGKEKGELCAYPLTSPRFFTAILLIWTFFLACEMKQTAFLSWHLLKLTRPHKGQVRLSEHGEHFVITHAGSALKCWIFVTVLLPKFAIAVVLWYIGARWLTATTGIDNLVLNSLALTFICELDELIFQTCVPEATKSCLEKVKLPLPPVEYSPTIWGPIEMMVTLITCSCLTMLYVYQLQDVIPDYRFDLEVLCEHAEHTAERFA